MAPKYDSIFKFILIGDLCVGKSCFVKRFVDGTYSLQGTGCMKAEFKTVELEGKRIRLDIWDPSGVVDRRYTCMRQGYYTMLKPCGIIVVYDVTDRRSFCNLKEWFEEIDSYVPENACKILIGAKSDLTSEKVVDHATAKEYADQLGMPFFEASALTGVNVEEAFMTLVAEVKRRVCSPPSDVNAVRETGLIHSVMRYIKRKSVRVSNKESRSPKNLGTHHTSISSSESLSEDQTSVTDNENDSMPISSTSFPDDQNSATDVVKDSFTASSVNVSEDQNSVTDDINDSLAILSANFSTDQTSVTDVTKDSFTVLSANFSEHQTSVTDDMNDSSSTSSTNSSEGSSSVPDETNNSFIASSVNFSEDQNTISDDINQSITASSLNFSEDNRSVTDDINDLFKERQGTDVTFALEIPNGTKEVVAHQLVLAMRSPYFADKFYGEQRNRAHQYIALKGFCPRAFEKMIRYCYDHKPGMKTAEEACALIKVAAEFKVMPLLNRCRSFLRYTKIEPGSVFSVLEISEKLADYSLRDMCCKILGEQTKYVLASHELQDVTAAMVRIILDLPKLSFNSEYELVQWMFDWAKYKSRHNDSTPAGIREYLEMFLQDMDFLSLTNEEFATLCQENPHFFNSAEMASIFLNIALPGIRDMPHWYNKCKSSRIYVGSGR